MERLIVAWRAMSARERRLVSLAAAVVLLTGGYLLLFEPAWRARTVLERDLPVLRDQLAQMLALQDELRQAASEGATRQAGGTVAARVALIEQSLRSAGLSEVLRKLEVNGELIELRFAGAPHERWFAWLSAALGETRMRVIDLAISRETAPGQVSARLVLEAPRSPR
jgi:type II secretory pathway component PulM